MFNSIRKIILFKKNASVNSANVVCQRSQCRTTLKRQDC